MHDVAMRRRIAALVIAALLAISGATLTTTYFATDAHAAQIVGTDKADKLFE
jgi:hypothetical protein